MIIKTKRTLKKMNSRIRMLIFLFVVALLVQGCAGNVTQTDEKEKYIIPDSLLHTLVIDTVKKCPLVDVLKLTGIVDFDQDKQVNIFSLVSGNVQDIKVQLGDYVTEGQVLAVVKSSEMAGYGNNLLIAETNINAAKKQLDVTNDLYKSGLASILDVTNAQVNYDQAESQLETAKKILKINGNSTNGDYIIRSPMSGFVVQKNITNNTSVRADNSTNLFTISDLKDVWVHGNIYEADINKVHIGDKVEVRILSEPDKVFTGKIDQMFNMLDPTSKVIKARVILKNPDYILKPQMFASISVISSQGRQTLCISNKALIYDFSQYYVLVYKGKSKVNIAQVEVINTLGNKTYLRSGVHEGDMVIASQTLQIYSELN
jgi:cobalt-zinc-cadmium efflux system membrane fusion protein